MVYIVEKKIGQEPHFYEDDWQPRWEHLQDEYMAYNELPYGYEALCITHEPKTAAISLLRLEGPGGYQYQNCKRYWPHIDFDQLENNYRRHIARR